MSKVALVSRPDFRKTNTYFPGKPWADLASHAKKDAGGWDVVYRFAQVGVRDSVVDWDSTCGNLIAAVAQVSKPIINFAIQNYS